MKGCDFTRQTTAVSRQKATPIAVPTYSNLILLMLITSPIGNVACAGSKDCVYKNMIIIRMC